MEKIMNLLNNDLDYNFGYTPKKNYYEPIKPIYEPLRQVPTYEKPYPVPTYVKDRSGSYVGTYDPFMNTLKTDRDSFKVSGNTVYNNFDRPIAQINCGTLQPPPVYYNPPVWNPMDSI